MFNFNADQARELSSEYEDEFVNSSRFKKRLDKVYGIIKMEANGGKNKCRIGCSYWDAYTVKLIMKIVEKDGYRCFRRSDNFIGEWIEVSW